MKLYQLGKGVYQYYREHVKGNEEAPHEIVQRKLTRNIALAVKVPKKKKDQFVYLYGNLHIYVRGNTIYKIYNCKQKNDWFYFNRNQWKELNEKLGINSKVVWNEVGNMDYIEQYAVGFTKQN